MNGEDNGRASPRRSSSPALIVAQHVALVGSGAVVLLSASSARWDPIILIMIAALTVVSELMGVETGSAKLRVSGSFLGIMLAAVLLGGAPAALVGVLAIVAGWLRWREPLAGLRQNLLTYAWFPLAAGLFFHATVRLLQLRSGAPAYYLMVFAAFIVALALNFTSIASYRCYLDGVSFTQKVREALVPLLSAELFSALLTVAAVYVSTQLGNLGLASFAVVLVIFQHLIGELLLSKHREQQLQRMASTDELTGLANRERFRARLQEQIATHTKAGGSFGVMLVDLDRFKEVNDTLGHHYGDELLRSLGPRLSTCVGPSGLVARIGGDEFAILPEDHTDDATVLEQLALRLLETVREPFPIDELLLDVSASIGISRFPLDGQDPNTLLRRADIAMYTAKERQVGVQLYTTNQDKHSLKRLTLVSDVRKALRLQEIIPHYQPIMSLKDWRPHGAEALVRWQHPRHGLIAPADFIPIVEQTGLIQAFTRYVLERAIAQCAQWRDTGQQLTVAVNLSVRNLLDPTLSQDIEQLLVTYALPPEALELEITESMMMSDRDHALATITSLSGLGIAIAIDDFGTGYSSLAYLAQLPIKQLKLDRSFVSPMLHNMHDYLIVKSTVNLGHDLGLTIVAEGVEDEPTLTRLAQLGCDRAQGYHLGRPMTPEAFAAWIRSSRNSPTDRSTQAASKSNAGTRLASNPYQLRQ